MSDPGSDRSSGQPAWSRQLPPPPGLVEAFRAYEQALMSDDVAALDRLFAPGPTTLRGDADGLLVGHGQISAFRKGRGGAPQRRLVQTHVQVVDDDHALVVAVTEPVRGGRGQQTQLWMRGPDGWRITAAHVSAPAPALDTRIWRVVGAPLVPPSAPTADDGVLTGETVAVKDLFAVAGQPIGAGNPEWLHHAPTETDHSWAVRALLDAGAAVTGITRTDEYAYSLAGSNAHHGTPPNPRAPGRLPGGSSSGSATAVSLGHATVGLGTDTGGSIRVPAAYQGLFGIRTTHGAVPRDGLLPLAPSFDTVGWLTRDAFTLRAVGDVLLPDEATGAAPGAALGSAASGAGPVGPGPLRPEDLVVVPALLQLADPDVATAIAQWLPPRTPVEHRPLADLDAWRVAFQTWQAHEAWHSHGAWLAPRLDTLGADVRGRFERARDLSDAEARSARRVLDAAREQILDLVGDRVLVVPSASTVAPPAATGMTDGIRNTTMQLTCVAGIGGLPAVSLPLRTAPAAGGLPCGVSLVAAPGRDRALLDLAVELTAEPTSI